ncbi:MAG TPA: aminotransferase class V-fold PLP-dependent enzyme [Acidobacteriota bacterium]|nr:aminotransferase class V-fold PLP-dependent enzyme [Acidobacteriota bacterium]
MKPEVLELEEVLCWRGEFPILESCVYLNSNSLGAMPRATRDNLAAYCDLWATRGVRAWNDAWWNMPAQISGKLAGIMGAKESSVSIHPNVTTAQWVALSSLDTSGRRRKVVYSELNFPSIQYFYQMHPDLTIETVRSTDGVSVPLEGILEAIDEDTLVVPISHVLFRNSYIQDVRAIVERAHAVGAYVILDVYHSCGVIPLDVGELGVDFAVGGVLKWLCGGPGVCFLYVNPELAPRLRPRLTGWFAHEAPMEFAAEMRFTDSSYRFMSGTPNIPGLFAALRGLEIISEVGVDRIRERSLRLTARIIELAQSLGIELGSPPDPGFRGGHVTINPMNPERVSQELLENDFVIDYRPGAGIRIAPHFYNTLEEVEQVMTAIEAIQS